MLLLGNDIVDLNETGVRGKFNDTRFTSRVFTESEQAFVKKSDTPDITLWSMWAAKESAYKVISKLRGTPVFSHRKFATITQESIVERLLVIDYQGDRIEVEVLACADYVVARGAFSTTSKDAETGVRSGIARLTPDAGSEQAQDSEVIFTAAERDSIKRPESAQVRFLCKRDIAEFFGIAIDRLQIIRPRVDGKSQPPFVLIDEKQCGVDVSLAHHGDWLAWCFSCPESGLPAAG